ncbi:hypothetical protein DV736_g4800, partial [Chaetothyriales sp. CBS 134916]
MTNIASSRPKTDLSWWKSATCYQIYPCSFFDSNGDGIGDLPGINSKLDYLADLGIDCIWISPMYASPQEDMGYDISDYEAIYPAYGTMSDMEAIIQSAHHRGIRVLLDLVVNHTSEQHKWFQQSLRGKVGDGAYGDFYIWKDPNFDTNGTRKEPNNWGSVFGGSAWEWVEERGQYYLHIFAKGQPDLNWEQDHVRAAIRESSMHFWFKKGIDGFRVDTCGIYSKDPSFKDGVVDERLYPYGSPNDGIRNGPRIHEFWREIRREVLDKYVDGDPLMVGELPLVDYDTLMKYVGAERRELSCGFDFAYVALGGVWASPPHEVGGYKLPEAKRAIQKTQDLIMTGNAWGTTFKENHDLPRSVTRHGTKNIAYWERAAKVLCMMTTTLSGTLWVYQGEEIGMTNIPESWSIDDLKDLNSINYYRDMQKRFPGDQELLRKAWKGVVETARDNGRTPMQWSNEKQAGFTTGKPWMRVNDNYRSINVADQSKSGDSVLAFWKSMIKIRKKYAEILMHGSYKVHDFENEHSWTFEKRAESGQLAIVMLNFSEVECDLHWPGGSNKDAFNLIISNVSNSATVLQPWECRLYIEKSLGQL